MVFVFCGIPVIFVHDVYEYLLSEAGIFVHDVYEYLLSEAGAFNIDELSALVGLPQVCVLYAD